MAVGVALTRASTFITFDNDADVTNGENVVIGGKTYTFQTTLTNADGNVKIGADHQETIANLVAAINLGDGAGTVYAAATTRNPAVYAEEDTDKLVVYALVPGTIGNVIGVDKGTTEGEPDNATLEGGTGNIADFFESLLQLNQINSEVLAALKQFTPAAD